MSSNKNNGILSGITSGLNSTYSYLAAQYPKGVTLEKLAEAQKTTSSLNLASQSFASYLESNFSSIDNDGDGIISNAEMENLSSRISTQGLTKEELTQLYASGCSGISESTMSKILEHFDDMDTNHDGKVTSAEIAAYDINSSRMAVEDEFNNRKAADMSVFYGDSSSSVDSYSLLSYKYKSNN